MLPVIIILFVIGSVILLGSFLFRSVLSDGTNREESEEYLNQMLQKRLDQAAHHLDDVAEESAGYIKKQTERELEKLSNQKITEVNEYSDQVMEQINKNHHEVMFLYGLLNDKQKELDQTVESLNQAQIELKRRSFELNQNNSHNKTAESEIVEMEQSEQDKTSLPQKKKNNLFAVEKPKERVAKNQIKAENVPNGKYDRRSKILHLAQEGHTDLEIAKMLSMGVGEVRLVLELSREGEDAL